MANPEHLKILRQGVPTWNSWRESQDGKAIIPDLRNANLKGIDLTKANLREVNFQKALLDNAKFLKANLTEAKFRESSLQYADFRYANLTKTDFYRADIYKASFKRVYFFEANFAKAIGIETVGLDLTISDGYTLETINTPIEGSYFVSTRESSSINYINLVFRDRIDWLAFIAAYKEINKEIAVKTENGKTLEILEIKDYNNLLIVKVEIPPELDETKIENDFQREYEKKERELYRYYQNILNLKDAKIEGFMRENINLTKLVENIAKNQSINNINISNVAGNVAGLAAGTDISTVAGGDIKEKKDSRELFLLILFFIVSLILVFR